MPDVSFDAGSPVAVYDSYDYGATPWVALSGTSFGAPAWSALVAIADQGRTLAGEGTLDGATRTIPDLYSIYHSNDYSDVFNDITTGVLTFGGKSLNRVFHCSWHLGGSTIHCLHISFPVIGIECGFRGYHGMGPALLRGRRS